MSTTTETASRLEPCPFAHTPDQLRLIGNKTPEVKTENYSSWVSCPVCGVSTVSFRRPKSAEHAWNARAHDALRAENAKLKAVADAAVQWRRYGYEGKYDFWVGIGPLLEAIDVYDVGTPRPATEDKGND